MLPEEYENMEFTERGLYMNEEDDDEGVGEGEGLGGLGGISASGYLRKGVTGVIGATNIGTPLEERINSIFEYLKQRANGTDNNKISGIHVIKSFLSICSSFDFFGASMFKVRVHPFRKNLLTIFFFV